MGLGIVENIFSLESNRTPFKIAILGLGGRSQYVLLECLKFNKNINIVAVGDDHATDSLNFFSNKLMQTQNVLLESYKNIFKNTVFYPDSAIGLKELFDNHKNLDIIFITSANYHHFRHLNVASNFSSCKKIYMEKPIFKDLRELRNFAPPNKDLDILVGLTLRYSSMAKIVVEKIREYKNKLGNLNQLQAWERVRFCQGLTSFLMSWRRHVSLSGGLLLEKSIHDLDLALFFIQALGFDLQEISVKTESSHAFFKKSQKKKMLHEILHNEILKKTLIGRELSPFQRLISFSFDQSGNINWSDTIDNIFKDFPDDDNFDNSDIIPDNHKLIATLKSSNNQTINFELEVVLAGFRPRTERGMQLKFEHGEVTIDVMQSTLNIKFDNAVLKFDLKTNNSDHADGDAYIAQAILGTLTSEQHKATFDDPTVQLATVLGLVSEEQALLKDNNPKILTKLRNHWVVRGV